MFRQCSWDSLETCDAGDDEKGAQRPAGKVIAKGVVNTRHKTEGLQTSDDSGGSYTLSLMGAQWNPRKAFKSQASAWCDSAGDCGARAVPKHHVEYEGQ
jgi:hypothetical protein